MKKDTTKTKVKFLIEKDGEGVFAYFPEDKADNQGHNTSYAHIGQHSACSKEYAAECEQATPGQYNDLKIELEQLGYNLELA